MKRFLLLVFLAICGVLHSAVAQTTEALASWPLTSNISPATGTGQVSVTTGQINASDETFSILSINQYSGAGGASGAAAQRLRINQVYGTATAAGWPAGQTTEMSDVYVQFSASPKTGNKLHVTSISLKICAMSIKTVKANVYYSTDPTFATSTAIPYTTGDANNYLLANASISDLTTVSATTDFWVNEGETIYVRAYPWIEALAAPNATKYFCIQDVKISGETESLPISSNVLYPLEADQSAVTTGPIVAETVAFSQSLKYYGKATLYSATEAAYQTVQKDWKADAKPNDTLWVQFGASPKTGGTLTVDSVSYYIGSWYTNNLKAAAYWSTNDFADSTLLMDDISLSGSSLSKIKAKVSATANTGEKFLIRIYPHNAATEGWAKLLLLDSVQIFGSVKGVTPDPPVVTTTTPSYISTTFATIGGNVSSDGGGLLSERGVCWNTTGTPTTSDNILAFGKTTGSFTGKLTGLPAGTTIYLRAYATNIAGTSYGEEKTFSTLSSVIVPVLTTNSVSAVQVKRANSGGNITNWGGDAVTVRGVCWNTTGSPTTSDSKTENGVDIGTFTSILSPLSANTTYYVRSYATNSAGTGYGEELSFTTQSPAADVIKIVDKDGSGDYTTVQEAFNAVPDFYTGNWIIFIKPGIYNEKVILAANKTNVILKGVHPDSTIITYNDYAGKSNGAGGTLGTSGSYTAAIEPDDFTAINVTFQNTIKNDETFKDQQAVALRTNGDRQSYYNCKLLGFQDTYYAWGGRYTGRVYFQKCTIEGSVDFIFGRDVCVFDSCTLVMNRNGGALTAASTDTVSKFGLVFLNNKITNYATGFNGTAITSFILGRPWQGGPRTVFFKCEEPATIDPKGWSAWNVIPKLYAEYQCTGDGSNYASRQNNGRQLTDEEAANYTVANIFAKTTHPDFGYDWLPSKPDIRFEQTLGTITAKTYGDADFSLDYTATDSYLPVTATIEDETIVTIVENKVHVLKAGSTNVTIKQSGTDVWLPVEKTEILEIAKANLKITVNDTSRYEKAENPEYRFTFEGFVNNDDITSIEMPTVTCLADANSAKGDYDITLSGGSAENYTLELVNGTLTVLEGTGIAGIDKAVLSIYPNPTINGFTISREKASKSYLSIYDCRGVKMIEKQITATKENIDTKGWAKGLYIVKINNVNYKLVIQ